MEIRWSYGRLISKMGFPIWVQWPLYIESGPGSCDNGSWLSYAEWHHNKSWLYIHMYMCIVILYTAANKCYLYKIKFAYFSYLSLSAYVACFKFNMWVGSLRWGCLVTWFCYQLIAKPGNKTAAPLWPDPCISESVKQFIHVLRIYGYFTRMKSIGSSHQESTQP